MSAVESAIGARSALVCSRGAQRAALVADLERAYEEGGPASLEAAADAAALACAGLITFNVQETQS